MSSKSQRVQIVQNKYDPDTYRVASDDGKTFEEWKVGPRYCILDGGYLGSGSFSRVCAAEDGATGTVVALKRIPDVVRNLDNARKVLREVCIQRRVAHPNVVALHDVFWQPSATGQMRMVDGRLQSSSIDVYLALEFCEAGDLHALQGQMSTQEVRRLVAQLVTGVQYLHDLQVWHRDLKSANCLLKNVEGTNIVKIADLGSARSGAVSESFLGRHESLTAEVAGIAMLPADMEKLKAAFGADAGRLTLAVCTPCYRAPEVVIARGKYNAAMDIWSIGCIFGELLQRMERSGSSFTPKLTIEPVFKLSPNTPTTPSMHTTFVADRGLAKRELQAIFDVIGTPEWRCIDDVESEQWRHYLANLPAQAPHLSRNFGFAGEPAVDLLRRMLAFDPGRRCCAAEAATHEYLAGALDTSQRFSRDEDSADWSESAFARAGAAESPSKSRPLASQGQPGKGRMRPSSTWLRLLEGTLDTSMSMPGDATDASSPEHKRRCAVQDSQPAGDLLAGAAGPGAGMQPSADCAHAGQRHAHSSAQRTGHSGSEDSAGTPMATDAPAAAAARSADAAMKLDPVEAPEHEQRYYNIAEPAAALKALEVELERLVAQRSADGSVPDARVVCDAICLLIKQECEHEAARQKVLLAHNALVHDQFEQPHKARCNFQSKWWGRQQPLEPDPRKLARPPGSHTLDAPLSSLQVHEGLIPSSSSPSYPSPHSRSGGCAHARPEPPGPREDILKPGRHGEWSVHSGRDLTAPRGPAWGGGLDGTDLDEATQAVVTRQQAR